MKLDFSAILRKFYIFRLDFREKIKWGDLFYAIFIHKIFVKGQKSIVFSMNLENPSNNKNIRSQK